MEVISLKDRSAFSKTSKPIHVSTDVGNCKTKRPRNDDLKHNESCKKRRYYNSGQFGQVINVNRDHYIGGDGLNYNDVKKHLENNSICALVMWLILRHCFDTRKGKVAFFFANIKWKHIDGSYKSVPVMVGHWSLLMRIGMMCFSYFAPRYSRKRGIRKDDLIKSFNTLTWNLSEESSKLRVVSGANEMTQVRQREGHFVMHANVFKLIAVILAPYENISTLLQPTSNPVTVRTRLCKGSYLTT